MVSERNLYIQKGIILGDLEILSNTKSKLDVPIIKLISLILHNSNNIFTNQRLQSLELMNFHKMIKNYIRNEDTCSMNKNILSSLKIATKDTKVYYKTIQKLKKDFQEILKLIENPSIKEIGHSRSRRKTPVPHINTIINTLIQLKLSKYNNIMKNIKTYNTSNNNN